MLYVDIPPGVFENDEDVASPDIMAILPSAIPEEANVLDVGPGFKFTFWKKEMVGIIALA